MKIYIRITVDFGRLEAKHEVFIGPDDGPAHGAMLVHHHATYNAFVAEDVATNQLHSEDSW